MSRGLSDTVLADLHNPNCETPLLDLLTVSGSGISTLRLVNDHAGIVSNGNTFTARAFRYVRPASTEGEVSRARIRVDDVGRAVVAELRAITDPFTVLVQSVRQAAPNTVLFANSFEGRVASYGTGWIEVELHPDPVFGEGYPGLTFTPVGFQGMFAR